MRWCESLKGEAVEFEFFPGPTEAASRSRGGEPAPGGGFMGSCTGEGV